MDGGSPSSKLSHNERLCVAFQRRHIRLRLRGTRLPPDYTVSLRLPSNNYRDAQPGRPKRKRRRLDPAKLARRNTGSQTGSDSDQPSETLLVDPADDAAAQASEDEADATIRINNAYTGATNSIGSIHQRHWFLTLDRKNSGFRQASSGRWEGPWEAFFVRGREVETSVVTGRKAEDVMADEGVKEFRGRKMWRAIVE